MEPRDPLPNDDELAPGEEPLEHAAETAPTAVKPLAWQAKALVVVVALAAVAALFWPRGDGSFEAPGGFLLDHAGRPATLGQRMEHVTLVHFWATWCPPCITEIPAIQRLASELAGEPDFALLMVAVSDSSDKVKPFIGHLEKTVLYDPSWEVAHRYGTRQIPETYLVVGGHVVEKYVGAQDWDDPAIREPILAALGEGRGGDGARSEG